VDMTSLPPLQHIDDLHQLGLIGYVRGIEIKLDELMATHGDFAAALRKLVREFDLKQYMTVLEACRERRS
ncbi:MAG TPA: hypothetical protein VM639_07465, partial [Dongiaceae bacterium]|nr:hypothetical protein [Terriglobia bacterium]HVJ41317.1 hypothetical protein [Dongiaceae bacterium]